MLFGVYCFHVGYVSAKALVALALWRKEALVLRAGYAILLLLIACALLPLPARADAFDDAQAYYLQRLDKNQDGVVDGHDWRLMSESDKYFCVAENLILLYRTKNDYPDPTELPTLTKAFVFGLEFDYSKDYNLDRSVMSFMADAFAASYH